jgi:hypothetical protein
MIGAIWCSQWLSKRIAQHDHLVVALDFVERLLQDGRRILGVAGKKFFERARYPRGRLDEAFALRVVAGPSDDGAYRRFDLGARWPPLFRMQGPDRLQRADI